MTDNELLLAISNMLDTKLQPLKDDITSVKLDIEKLILMKKVVTDHSEELKKIS